MSDPGAVSPGEVGGIFAGVVALLATIGAGLKWLLNWNDARAQTRSAKLDAWHQELAAREAKLDAEQAAWQTKLEQRIAIVERENRGLKMAFELVAPALRRLDPHSEELARAEKILDASFALDPELPPELQGPMQQLGAID